MSQHSHQAKPDTTATSKSASQTSYSLTIPTNGITQGRLDTDQILYLQRTIGNYATRQLLQRDPHRVVFAGAVSVAIGEDEFDDEDEDEFDDEELRELRTELQSTGKDAFVEAYGWSAFREVLNHITGELMAGGEEAITGDEITWVIEMFEISSNFSDYRLESIKDQSPTIKMHFDALDEAKAIKSKKDTEEAMMENLRLANLRTMHKDLDLLLMAKQYYENPPEDFEFTDELRSLVESDTWSFVLSDGIETLDDLKKLLSARIKFQEAEKADVKAADPISQLTEGIVDTYSVASQGMSVSRGVSLLADINKETNGKDMVTAGMETLFSKIISYTFAPISIGADLIRAYHYNKRRRDGYEAAMGRAGIDKDGTTSIKGNTAEEVEKIRLGRVAYYAFNKTRRAFRGTIVRATLKLVRWIAHIITVLSGGTTAVVTGAIAVSADISRSLMAIGKRLKGLYKVLTGKRGVGRKRNAQELMALATGGNMDAIQTIWDVNPFDEVSTGTKKAWNATGGLGVFGDTIELPKPDSVEDLKTSLKTGYYSDFRIQKMLTNALQNTMKS